jgi:phosphatidylinositol phospholipase C delta
MSRLSSRLAKLKPFSNADVEDEDQGGEETEPTTIAGGGHSTRPTDITQHKLRVSHALRSFLVKENVLSSEEAGIDDLSPDFSSPAIHTLVDKPHIQVPSYITDRSHPLPEYFISSSHNTYLLAHQLFGTSSATAYETALKTGARCIEIDAWNDDDNKEEPKVTHGFTLVSHIPFRAVCETIRDVVDAEAAESPTPAPVLISLENHCDAHGQLRLVQIMREVWAHRLLSEAVIAKGHAEQDGSDSHVRLSDLGAKIVVIVEYHFPNEPDSDDSSSSDSSSDSEPEDEEELRAKKEYKARKAAAPKTVIIPELAALGVYAQSVKPVDDSWYEGETTGTGGFKDAPHHHLINVSETGLAAKMPAASERIARHNARHLMRVFPKGTRVSSMNLDPVPFWGVGAQICALNWQTFGAPLQLNEALFAGSDGFVLKPAYLRPGGASVGREKRRRKLRLHVAGATDVPVPSGRPADEVKLYLSCLLDHPAGLAAGAGKKKTAAYKQHKLGFLHTGDNPPSTDPVWDEVLEWEYDDDELVFLRMLVKSDDSFARNPTFAVATVRILYAAPGWSFIRMLDLKGRETRCSLLVKLELDDV